MKHLIIGLIFAIALIAPASALDGNAPYYWVVYGYSYPQDLVAGPFDNDPGQQNAFTKCSYVAGVYNQTYTDYKYHCVIK